MAYEDYCASCTYLNERSWCERKGEEREGNDPKCYNWCEAYSRSNYARENLFERGENKSSGCYITTIMCKLLGYNDNNYYLNTLRSFRENVMKKNIGYIPLLITYDMVGPKIAQELSKDENGKEIAAAMFNNYITKSVGAIEEGKNEMAINTYLKMTQVLAQNYGIDMAINEVDMTNIDMETLGHGRVRKLVPNKI